MTTATKTLRIDADTHFFPPITEEELRPMLADVAAGWPTGKLEMVVRDAVMFCNPNAKRTRFGKSEAGQRLLGNQRTASGPIGHGDPVARAELLPESGFDMQILLPDGIYRQAFGSPTSRQWEHGIQLAICRAYNHKVADAQRQFPNTFIGAGVIPNDDVAEACNELHLLASLGLKAVTITGNWKGRNWDDPILLPFWETLQQLGLVLLIHHNPFTCTVNDHAPTSYTVGWERLRRLHVSNFLGAAFEYMIGLGALTLGGVLQQFPGLKICFYEAGGSWLPWAMYTLDRSFQVQPQCARCDVPPSELILENCMVAVEPDEEALVGAIDAIGSKNFVIGSDYPHPPSTFPYTISGLSVFDLPDEDRDNLLGGNLQRFLGIS